MTPTEIVEMIARCEPYTYEDGSWTDDQAEDAIVTLNRLIEEARAALGIVTDPNSLNGYQVRHDLAGWYVCSDEEAEHEDEGNPSVGFDGRDHWSTIELAQEALREIAND